MFIKLYNCPFCGDKALVEYIQGEGWKVRCESGICVQHQHGYIMAEDAIEHWNGYMDHILSLPIIDDRILKYIPETLARGFTESMDIDSKY